MKLARNLSLYWRLLASYLLIILVGCSTFYLAGDTFAALFFDQHMGGIMQRMRGAGPMMDLMVSDLGIAYRQASRQGMMWGMSAAALIAIAVSLFVSRRIVAPVRKMQHASRRIAAGRYQERLDPQAPGEIGELATSFNDMAHALEQTETRRVDLLANVAHEFKTPLSSLRGYVTGLRDGTFEAEDETFEACARQVARLERLVTDLALLSRVETGQETLQLELLAVADLLEAAASSFRPDYGVKNVALSVTASTDVYVQADAERTLQALTNLLDNALKHTPCGGTVSVTAQARGSEILFEVRDSGEGVAAADLPHLFTRFYRTDKARQHAPEQGSGIGLTIVKHYVERQGGRVGVTSVQDEGSVFWFTLPRATTAPAHRP
ncbi:MAG: HAMP domain-containing histidine kinase [Deinococcota bacterium]|nr:HAMP domain-containing histidine kinase [Deinococcota bacterium]